MAKFEEITTIKEWEKIFQESKQKLTVLFKHSTSCPISARAWKEVQAIIQESPDDILVVMVKVIEFRPVSNQVAEDLQVKHESPQIFILKDKEVVWHTSHSAITANKINENIY